MWVFMAMSEAGTKKSVSILSGEHQWTSQNKLINKHLRSSTWWFQKILTQTSLVCRDSSSWISYLFLVAVKNRNQRGKEKKKLQTKGHCSHSAKQIYLIYLSKNYRKFWRNFCRTDANKMPSISKMWILHKTVKNLHREIKSFVSLVWCRLHNNNKSPK